MFISGVAAASLPVVLLLPGDDGYGRRTDALIDVVVQEGPMASGSAPDKSSEATDIVHVWPGALVVGISYSAANSDIPHASIS